MTIFIEDLGEPSRESYIHIISSNITNCWVMSATDSLVIVTRLQDGIIAVLCFLFYPDEKLVISPTHTSAKQLKQELMFHNLCS